MLSGWVLVLFGLLYGGVLFAIAYLGDRRSGKTRPGYRALIFSLSLAVYCSAWTFYGVVGRASNDGIGYIAFYLGPILMLLFGMPLLRRILAIAKRQNSTSIADFIAARYGKSASLAALVTLIAMVGVVPYIALQLKAVSMSYNLLTRESLLSGVGDTPIFADTALYVALAMAVFAILFGARQLDATEHHPGMVRALAFESIVKLLALLLVGIFVCMLLTADQNRLLDLVRERVDLTDLVWGRFDAVSVLINTIAAGLAFLMLPRQFHILVVENTHPEDLRLARWLIPLYLILFSLFVLPIAAAGMALLPDGRFDADGYVLGLPILAGADWLALLAFLGGSSAATGMVIVSSVALSIMVSNEILVPWLFRFLPREQRLSRLLLLARQVTIVVILLLAYLFYRLTGETYSLATIGLLSFAAVVQFAPALIGGVLWRRANRQGALAGMVVGGLLWVYTLLIPALTKAGWLPATLVLDGPWGLEWLRPTALFGLDGLDSLTHGLIYSLTANLGAYVILSLTTRQHVRERIQVAAFFETPRRPFHESELGQVNVTNSDILAVAERFLGKERTRSLIRRYRRKHNDRLVPGRTASDALVRFVESELAKAIGSSTARVVLDSTLRGRDMALEDVVSIVDEASQAMRFSRELLHAALDNINMGVSVVDRETHLVAWNQRYADLFNYPPGMLEVGRPLADLVRYNLQRTRLPPEKVEELVNRRLHLIREGMPHEYERHRPDGTVLLVQGNPMPGGGFVTTFSDITERRKAEIALQEANTLLEERVRERTEELSELNKQLMLAKSRADQASQSKTRFLAAASHDLLQPLNAARLFVAALSARVADQPEASTLAQQIGSSLNAAEEILVTLLDISKLDAGALEPQVCDFNLGDMLQTLSAEFAAIAESQGLMLRTRICSVWVRSDPKMLRRVVQNFLSNAIRYTRRGKVLLGCRRTAQGIRIEVWDTGPGIPQEQLHTIFEEFKRLDQGQQEKKGLGLGLAIVDRICRVLGHPVKVVSTPGRGSVFGVTVPFGQAPSVSPVPAKAPRQLGSMAGARALCIDNEPSILEGMAALLSNWEVEVRCASNEAEALGCLEDWAPDILMADYQLDDGANGLDLMDRLRGRAGRPLPGILITAVTDNGVRDEARERGYAILRKPIKPASLRALMQKLLGD